MCGIVLWQDTYMDEKQYGNDLKSFNQLFNDYQERFLRFANSYVRDISVAEDITMESLMYFWEKHRGLQNDLNVPAYILTVIKHKCINYLQHLKVREAYSEHAAWELNLCISTLEAFEPYELFTAEIQNIIEETLACMPEQTRKVFMLSRYENHSNKEIAEFLHLTSKGVEYHITKALSSLRASLKDYLPLLAFFL